MCLKLTYWCTTQVRARKTKEKMLTGKVMLNSVQMQMQMQICACRTHWCALHVCISHADLPPHSYHVIHVPKNTATIKVAGVMQKSSEILHSMNRRVLYEYLYTCSKR